MQILQLKVLYNDIIKNWEAIDDEDEKKTLMQYSERGRMLTIGYISMFHSIILLLIERWLESCTSGVMIEVMTQCETVSSR